MDSIEKASILMGKSYTKTQEGAAHSSNVTMITGTAMSDSTDGVVSVDLGGNTISADDEQAVDISTTCAVKAGDVVQVSVIGADGTAKSLLVTGVIAGGDRMQADIETAKDTSAAADTAAAVAKENAEKANELANSAITNANTANEQAQNAMNSVNAANGKISTLQKNVDTMNGDISAAQTAISKNASDISGINQKLSTDYATKGEVSDVKVAVESDIDTKANALTASVAETYAAKSDVTKITDDLSNRITINEKGISSSSDEIKTLKSDTADISKNVTAAQDAASAAQKTADTAVSNANAAQTAAGNAQTAADKAQSTANGASTAAATAQSAADSAKTAASNAQNAANSAKKAANNAKSAADKANSDLAKLTDTVTTQGTKINQNSDSITSVASRTTTVENKFTNYYTKTETNSQIKQTADGINSTISKKVGKDEVISSINQSAEEVKINANRVAINGTLSVTDAINNAQNTANAAQTAANSALYWKTDTWIDLSASTYDQNTWYPVVSDYVPAGVGTVKCFVDVELNSGTKPTWSTHDTGGFTVLLEIEDQPCGWGALHRTCRILTNTYCWVKSGDPSPASYRQMANSNRFVFFLRGGGNYHVLSTQQTNWSIKTETFTINGQSVSPTTTYPEPDGVNVQQTAVDASDTANTTKTYFYNDTSGSHVTSQNSTSAGTRTDVKSDGMHIVDQDDGKELASFTSSGAAIGKDSEIHTKYSTNGINFYEKNKSYPFTRIYPVSIENEKYSAASISSSPSDVTDAAVMDDGFWHSSGSVSTSAVDGTSTDNNGWARAVLSANTVQSNDSKTASIEAFASNNNPNKGSGGVGGVNNYINMTAEEIYINNTSLLNKFFPIGKLWISTDPTSPASIVGGSWEQIEAGRTIVAAGDGYEAGSTGGEATHSLTIDEIPSHSHTAGSYDGYKIKNDWFQTSGGSVPHNVIGVINSGKNNYEHGLSTKILTNTTGGGQSHNNMQPYYATYMWRRIA